jgi:hypothetical protein
MNPYQKPLGYWTAAIAGLVTALLSDGWGDLVGLACLSAPIARLLYSGLTTRASR